MESGDQRVQTAAGAAGVVHAPAAICAVVCGAGCAAPSAVAIVVTGSSDVEQVGFHQWGVYLNGVWVPL